jgi:hypothetical protein
MNILSYQCRQRQQDKTERLQQLHSDEFVNLWSDVIIVCTRRKHNITESNEQR